LPVTEKYQTTLAEERFWWREITGENGKHNALVRWEYVEHFNVVFFRLG